MRARPRRKRSVEQLAELLDLSVRQVEVLAAQGVLTRARRGVYPLVPNVRAYIGHLRRKQGGGEVLGTLEFARRRKVEAEAELTEMELAQRRGELITVDDSVRELTSILEGLRAGVLNVPGKHAPQFLGIHTIAEAQLRLEVAASDIMRDLQDRAVQAIEQEADVIPVPA